MRAKYLLVETGRGIRHHIVTFLLSCSVQAVCLTMLGLFAVLAHNVMVVARSATRRIELHAFLSDDADAVAVENRIRCLTGVVQTTFVSQEDALAELKTELGMDSALATALEANPLPASIRITLQPGINTAVLKELERKITLLPGVAEVWSGQETLVRLNRLVQAALWTGLILLAIVSLAVAFVVFQTVDASLSARRREIEIMELVGADRLTVDTPFLLEGTAQGILAGSIAFIVVWIMGKVTSLILPAIELPLHALLVAMPGLGCLLGLIGSRLALNRLR